MTNLSNYQADGADYQPRAVLAILQGIVDFSQCDVEPKISRWENGREQGYVVTLRSKNYCNQLNIAFFEHRNSDSIHAVKWEQLTMNSPTVDTADFGNIYKDKNDTSYNVSGGEIVEMAKWIANELQNFWISTSSVTDL